MKFLITAGPTREPIDPVRFLSNRSSGKMGYAIAQAALDAGHEVILISGPVCLAPPERADFVRVVTSDEMFNAVQQRVGEADVLVMCAAVADFKPAQFHKNKIKKSDGLSHIALVPTRDILRSLTLQKKSSRKKIVVMGFAAETQSLAENAKKKLREKQCDVIAANDVSRINTGFESDENALTLFFKNGEVRSFARANKVLLAKKLVDVCVELTQKS